MTCYLLIAVLGLALFLGTYRLSTAVRNLACDAIVDAIDPSGPGTITIRTSTQPTNVGDAENGTLLGTLTFSATAFGAASTGTATASSITSDTSADNSGTAAHFRIFRNAGIHSDGTCGTSGADLNFDSVTIVAGGVIAISSLTITQPIS